MNYFEFHLGDWAKKCSHLTAVEEGLYMRLLHWYYGNERCLPSDTKQVCRIARVRAANERAACVRVLHEFFELMDDGWHNARADKEIARFEKGVLPNTEKRAQLALRQQRSRLRRQSMFDALRAVSVVPHFNATNYALADLCKEHGIPVPEYGPIGGNVTRDVTVTSQLTDTHAQQPDTSICSPPVTRHGDATAVTGVTEEALGTAVRAIRKAGFAAVNAQDPRLMALLRDGAQADELAVVAAEATAKGKGWAWFLATVKGRRADAREAPKTARQRAAADTVRAWVPQLAAKP